jgi:hypothetical protein
MVSMILILIAMSYFIIIIYARDWFFKTPNVWIFLSISLLLSIYCNLDTFILKNSSQNIMILNGPLITMIIYLIFYKLYSIIFDKELASPMECFYGNNMTFTWDSLFTLIFMLTSMFLIPWTYH